MIKVSTDCCALCQIAQVNNKTPIEDFKWALNMLSKEKINNKQVFYGKDSGQTATFTIVSPGEDQLEANLIELGYTHIWTFERRVGYPKTGDLKMYIKNL